MLTHKLIRLIRARPMLYNFEMEDYNNKIVAERKWLEIAMEMNASVSECKTKWNSLRTAYNTYLNKLKRLKKPRTKWIHADEMAFLKQYLKRNRYHHNDPMISNDPNSDQSIPETFVKSEDRFDGFDSRLEQQSTLLIKHFYMRQNDKDKSSHIIGKQELIEGSEEFLTSNQTEEKIVKEQTRRIVLEAPDSVLICLDRNHHKNLLSCNRNNHEQSEIEIFCDFIAKKLKSFSVPIRMDIVTKICQLISEATIREFNFSNTIINNDDDIKESSSHPIILSPIAQMHLKHFEKHFESQKREKSL
ncbi:C1GALT1-specific chaperone 1-like [Sarcoptes scabiei]|nr:C1GALT1-specific chaperone 1-like [Sarcoptes scabiei]